MADIYTVWVGGTEVCDTLLPKEEADGLANLYRLQEYEDVCVERYSYITPQLKSYLWQEFSRNNLPKYYKYFEPWVNTLTYEQALYFTAYMLEQKTCLNFCSLELYKP